MNRLRRRKKPKEEMKKLRGWKRKLQDGCIQKKKQKEELLRKHLRKQKKQLGKKKKKRKGS